jgi:hypothetical protein
MSTKLLNRRQTRWAEYLSHFNFKIVYRPGKAGTKPNSLTRRSGDLPQGGDDYLIEQHKAVLKPHNLSDELQLWEAVLAAPCSALSQDILKATQTNPFAQRIITALFEGKQHSREITLSECQVHNGYLYYQHRLYIPADDALQLRIIQNNHDVPAAGHPGRAKTFDLIRRRYFWPTLRKDVERFIANCHICQRMKTSRHTPYGILNPLPVPKRPWRDILMDFMTGLPISDGHNAIWVVIDRLTKMRHFVPCSTTVDAKELANLFVMNIFHLHGLPDSIISDRGPQFASRFWKYLCNSLHIEPCLSTAFHPETDGQTQRTNSVMEQYLRAYVNYQQDNGAQYLPLAEFTANNHVSETTGLSPYFANYGMHPKLDLEPDLRVDNPEEGQAQSLTRLLAEIHDFAKA